MEDIGEGKCAWGEGEEGWGFFWCWDYRDNSEIELGS
eukprot:CAMPEP_0197560904 /NCGR_PEP_ID=MMETSP1320-20131121/24146_1 /TAXON_ID=91990 /ORGANISM="Bolidomonas sp., Strain RCC2347" /LENGTH=36 /DNA_ID= /DNA_START= /DNA_END= /DNA_ORIENTATION=